MSAQGNIKAVIAGGGIGGLTAALALAHHGHEVVVLERANAFTEVGAGLQIPPNAVKVLRALGIADRVARDAVRPLAIETRMGRSGRTVFRVPLGAPAERRWGAPYLHIHRADYIDALVDCVQDTPNITLHLGAELSDIQENTTDVGVTLNDGRTVSGDMLIGSDGLNSRVREWLHGPDTPRFTGNVAWRAVVPMDVLGPHAPELTACAWMGRGRHAVTYRVRGGAFVNFVGVVERDDPGREDWAARGAKAEALRDFEGWHPTVTQLIEAVSDGALFRWALYDRDPLPFWSRGRVSVLGDAAHPMLPFMAQGAAMATEDAWVLADALSRSSGVEAALQTYHARRIARASRVQAASRANAKTFHRRTLPTQLATYSPMWLAGRIAPGAVRARFDWLYGMDVTA